MIRILITSIIVFLVGSLLHFTYHWSKNNKFVSLFSAVNESTWEHIKIALVPSIISFLILDSSKAYATYLGPRMIAASVALLSIIIIIPVMFYSIEKITKKLILWVDILEFFIAIFVAQLIFQTVYSAAVTELANISDVLIAVSSFVFVFIVFAVLIFTARPPKNFLFLDPISKKYGLDAVNCEKHSHSKAHKIKSESVKTKKKTTKKPAAKKKR